MIRPPSFPAGSTATWGQKACRWMTWMGIVIISPLLFVGYCLTYCVLSCWTGHPQPSSSSSEEVPYTVMPN